MPHDHSEIAVTKEHIQAIVELQSLPCLSSFALAGGTNLALRFNHRRTVDIDLFSSEMMGRIGIEAIQSELEKYYKEQLINCEVIDPEAGNQFYFLRAFIHKTEELIIRVEIIQNIPLLDPFENNEGIRMLSLRDIGLLKLMSASNRKAKKDIYDLDFVTDEIPLPDLFSMLEKKQSRFKGEAFKTLFDLDSEQSPINDINLLLAFDQTNYRELPRRPDRSNDTIDILSSSKNWSSARAGWRRKVINLMRSRGIKPPPARPIN